MDDVEIVAMAVTTVIVLAIVQNDSNLCLIFQSCHQNVSKTHCFAYSHSDLLLMINTSHTFSNTKQHVIYVRYSDHFSCLIHFKKEHFR